MATFEDHRIFNSRPPMPAEVMRMLVSIFNRSAIGAVILASLITPLEAGPRAKRDRLGDELQVPAISAPVMAVVALKNQRISVYDAEGRAIRAKVSSGQTGYETPVGVYSILQKNEEHYSNLYDDAEMPFMQRLTWSGVALHGGALPGYPASHGCVRLPESFAKKIFHLSKLGMRVVVVRDEVAPTPFSHPLLLQPKPISEAGIVLNDAAATPTAFGEDDTDSAIESVFEDASPFTPDLSRWPARQRQLATLISEAAVKAEAVKAPSELAENLQREVEPITSRRDKIEKARRAAEKAKSKAETKLKRAETALAKAKSAAAIKSAENATAKARAALGEAETKLALVSAELQTVDQELAQANEKVRAAEAAKKAAVAEADEAKRKTLPVSIFISLKTQRLYVRQGHQPVLDAPVTIRDPDRPIGTHIFTAVDYADDGNELRWTALSIARRSSGDDDARGRRSRKKGSEPPATDVTAATTALDRVTLPQDIADRLSEFVWPGSSLIVSDEPMSKETGKATDFVVLISTEPQGGIKKRPKKPPQQHYDYYSSRDYEAYYYEERARRRYRGGLFYWW